MAMFKDREEAGKLLAEKLLPYKSKDCIILAIPRGGVVVGFEVAKELSLPLDIVVTRKLGAPYEPELAIGAVAPDGSVFVDENLVRGLKVPENYIQKTQKNEIEEIKRRMKKYRGDKRYPNLKNKTLIVVDDGIATGATVLAAVKFLQKKKPKKIIVVTPVISSEAFEKIKTESDDIIALDIPAYFGAVGNFYQDFPQTSDEEVIELLKQSNKFV